VPRTPGGAIGLEIDNLDGNFTNIGLGNRDSVLRGVVRYLWYGTPTQVTTGVLRDSAMLG
jgi:hypothetical protein